MPQRFASQSQVLRRRDGTAYDCLPYLLHPHPSTVEAHQRYSKLLKAKLDEPRPVEPKLVEPEEEVYTV